MASGKENSATAQPSESKVKIKDVKGFLMSQLDETVKEEEVSLFRVEGVSASKSIFVRHPNMNGGFDIDRLTSAHFRSWLHVNFCGGMNTKRITINNVISSLEDLAEYDTTLQQTKLFMRVGNYEGKIYLNLCNEEREVVVVDEEGWRTIKEDEAPVLFVHSRNMKALPSPIPYAEFTASKDMEFQAFDKLRLMVNTSEEDFFCVIGWLIAALNPSMQCPILWMSAGKGRGKTTLTNCLKDLIDPDITGALAPFEKEKDFSIAASSRYIIGLDNFSKLTHKWSNIFCRAVTGEGIVQRKLYSDDTALDMSLRVPMIINGIDFKPARSDLQDRCFPVTLQKLNADKRRTEHELEELFEQNHQLILSALLNAVSSALRNKDYKPRGKNVDVRMLDASLFIMKAANAGTLPFSDEKFRDILLSKKSEVDAAEKAKLFDDPLSSIIYDMAVEKARNLEAKDAQNIIVWDDATSKLLEEIRERAKKGVKGTLNDIPSSPRAFGRRLSGEAGNILKANDISIVRGRSSKQRNTIITFSPSQEDFAQLGEDKNESSNADATVDTAQQATNQASATSATTSKKSKAAHKKEKAAK